MAAGQEISVNAAVVSLLSEWDGIFRLKEEQIMALFIVEKMFSLYQLALARV